MDLQRIPAVPDDFWLEKKRNTFLSKRYIRALHTVNTMVLSDLKITIERKGKRAIPAMDVNTQEIHIERERR